MPEHPTLGALVGIFLATVSAISIWTAARPGLSFLRRQVFGFLSTVAVGLVFCTFSGADFEWLFLLGTVWVVVTAGLVLLKNFGFQLVEAKSVGAANRLGSSQYSLLELVVFATAIACLSASTRYFSHTETHNFFVLFAMSVAITCFGLTSLTIWACLSAASRVRRYTLLLFSTLLFAGFVYQAMEVAMAITALSRGGVAGFVWVIALLTYVSMTSMTLCCARCLGFRIVRLNSRTATNRQPVAM